MAENSHVMEKIVALAKRRGFIYPGSEIYGGLANTYDYGPVGVELLRNIKNLWWKYFVQTRPDMVGIDGSIISHHKIWEASGHVAGFADAMVDCKNCKARMRADHLIENFLESSSKERLEAFKSQTAVSEKELENVKETGKVEGLNEYKLDALIGGYEIKCPNCKAFNWTPVRKFNLLFPVQLGIVEGEGGMGYLRGETAQLIFTNFRNVTDSTRVRLPFGIAQLGKSFRNEITPGNSVFRTIEFEQGEIEYFFDPDETKWEPLFEEWKKTMDTFVTKELGIRKENLRWRTHTDDERSFYSKRTEDMEYQFPFGFKELWGLAYRTDYDLTQHKEASKKDLTIVDPKTQKKILPHVIEPAVGINRLLLMVLADAYVEEETKTVLKIDPKIAPYKVAVFPLLANKPELVKKAKEIFAILSPEFMTAFDDRGNIGKRYLSQDEIGTPWCVTVDFDTLEDDAVTVRDRDTTKQERITVKDLVSYFTKKLE
ncbi:MAG TPA: glycine--tRNA ligase [Candidatus Acidoferrales bacterium]|nr:glycine--tRNA ligase [Candidatus Acidoferrales bacterium]